MRIRTAGLIASRVLAIYVGFTAVIFVGQLVHAIYESRPGGEIAESLIPAAIALSLAGVLWFSAPAVAARLAAGAAEETEQAAPARASDLATIAFAVAGLFIASQAIPLAVHAIVRVIAGASEQRDAAADLLSALVRAALGGGVAAAAPAIGRRMFPRT